MPELPEVETVRRGLEPALVGARFDAVELRRADLRFPFPNDFQARLTGRRIDSLSRRAKFLLAALDDGSALLMHLGMSGSFRVDGGASACGDVFHRRRFSASEHDHVAFRMSNGARVVYNDPRRFGFMDLVSPSGLGEHKMLRALGVEPLDPAFDGAALAALLHGRRAPLKTALLDQRLIAGLGNIYVCEALFRARLSPLRPAGAVSRRSGGPTKKAHDLAQAIKAVLNEAIAAGGSSLRDHRQTDGSLGYFQHRFEVYDREGAPCAAPRCEARIRRLAQSGRSTFYCPSCQR